MIKNNKQTLSFCIVLHQPNLAMIDSEEGSVQETWNKTLFPAITNTYIPLLKMLDYFKNAKIPVKINMVISPTLCELLDDYMVQELYTLWLENLMILGEQELQSATTTPEIKELITGYLQKFNQSYSYFAGLSEGNLLLRFKEHIKNGTIELLATTAEHCYLPHYVATPELIRAQIEAGLMAHKRFFDVASEGFWLPLMGYAPGIEDIVQEYGFNYTILNSRGVLFADPSPKNGIFAPLQSKKSLAVFAHDSVGYDSLFGITGIHKNPQYRNQKRDIGFEKKIEELDMLFYGNNSRYETGFKYWSKNSYDSIYNPDYAQIEVMKDAIGFFTSVQNRLETVSKETSDQSAHLLYVIDEKMLGQYWYEGINWLTEVYNLSKNNKNVSIVNLTDLMTKKDTFDVTDFFMSSAEGIGYGENLLDNSNCWIYRYNLKIVEQMIDLTKKFPNDGGLRERALNMAAKIVLFATSSDWAKVLTSKNRNRDELELLVKSIIDFSVIFDSLGSNEISTEWLTETEKKYPFFENVNYRIFCTRN